MSEGVEQVEPRPEAWEELDAGDAAWAAGDRRAARAAWSRAAAAAAPATEAAAAARLLLVGGTGGLLRYGPRLDAALARCPARSAWCQLAAADRELFPALIGVPGTSPQRAAEAAARALAAAPGPATARLVWAGAAPLAALDGVDGGGLEAALRVGGGRWPAGPGTWAAGVAPIGASGLGAGLGLALRHPDLGLRGARLDAQLGWTNRGQGGLALSASSPAREGLGVIGGISVQRVVFDTWEQGQRVDTARFWSGALTGAPRWQRGPATAWLGPQLRWDAGLAGHGGAGGLSLALPGPWRGLLTAEGGPSWETGVGAAALGQAELRRDPGAGGLALRAAVGGAPIAETPVWRLQPIGGGGLLRHGPTGRWRSRAHGALVVEGRAPVGAAGALSLCPFAEGAWIQADGEAPGLHGGLGLGLRLALPPRPTNLLRLDAAWGDAGLGISAGWGQSF
ncbi:MAG: hypothetical protein RL071_2533 [Pseudomonadota bacterium]